MSQFEHEHEIAASMAYSRGDIEGAVGFIAACANTRDIELPRRPLPKASRLDTIRSLTRYYFECVRLISEHRGKTITSIRQNYSQPYKVMAAAQASKAKTETAKSQNRQP